MWQTGGLPVLHRVTVVKLLTQHVAKDDSWVPTSGSPPCWWRGYQSFMTGLKWAAIFPLARKGEITTTTTCIIFGERKQGWIIFKKTWHISKTFYKLLLHKEISKYSILLKSLYHALCYAFQ